MSEMEFEIDKSTNRHGKFTQGFFRPEITREVLKEISRLKYLEVNDRSLTADLVYKDEKMFELVKNLFYGKAYYGDFYIGGDIPVDKIYVGDSLGYGVFEREVNLYNKTKEQIEEKYEKSCEEFRNKIQGIKQKAKTGIVENLKSLNPVGVYRDFTVFVNSIGILKNFRE